MKNNFLILSIVLLAGCSVKTSQVLLTAESGEKCQKQAPITFRKAEAVNPVVVNPQDERQVLDGYGVSLTESSAFVLACVSDQDRKAILDELFSQKGANFPIVRTQIGASDFSVEGKYALVDDNDTTMQSFSLREDQKGFPKSQYPQIQNEHYDLYNLIKDVVAINPGLRIHANAWTAPAWMKDNGKYYERDWSRGLHRGGALLPRYYQTYADYLLAYLRAWQQEGVRIWSMTPVNEPMGNDGGWESMDMPPAAEAEFIGRYMGPTLKKNGFGDVRILGFDQNIFEMGPYTKAIYSDSEANRYTTGMAIHWYGSTISCYPYVLDSVHALYPDKTLLHTEGCIDNLGCPAWDAVTDPKGFTESGWFNNDSFWWNPCATDWAYSTPYAGNQHPAYAPCQRYAQYIIEGMNHWMTGFIDWNCVLDTIGGPNHVANYTGAPVMIDADHHIIYYTPYYYILKQFSRTMRPGDVALGVSETDNPNLFVSAARRQGGDVVVQVLNKSKQPIRFPLQVGSLSSTITAPANSLLSLVIPGKK